MDASFHIRKFGFDQVFSAAGRADALDDADPWIRIEALRAQLTIACEDREAQLAAARNEGFLEGQAHARSEQSAALLAATDAIHGAIEGVEAELEAIAERTVRDAAAVACAAADVLAGRALDLAPGGAIDEAIGRALRQVARGQEIQVSVHPDMVALIETIVATRQAGDRRRLAISVAADAAIAWGDAHIHWDQGGIILDAAARGEAIREALTGVLPTD